MPIRGSGTGARVHAEGYIQIIRRGPWRGWLEHRKVILEALQESDYWKFHPDVLDRKLPAGMTVEHLDHDKKHNCLGNLMLLDKRIHDWISWDHGRRMREAYGSVIPAEEPFPDWVTEDTEGTEGTVGAERAALEQATE